jgi:hypothetical protein
MQGNISGIAKILHYGCERCLLFHKDYKLNYANVSLREFFKKLPTRRPTNRANYSTLNFRGALIFIYIPSIIVCSPTTMNNSCNKTLASYTLHLALYDMQSARCV